MFLIDFEMVLSWIGHALTWYVVGLLAAMGVAQYFFDSLQKMPTREAFQAFAVVQVLACHVYFVGVAWIWLSLFSVDIRSYFGQIILVISAFIINASVLMLVSLWLARPRKGMVTA